MKQRKRKYIDYADIIESARSIVPYLPRDVDFVELSEAIWREQMEHAIPRIMEWPPFGFMVFHLAVMDALAQEEGYTGLARYVPRERRMARRLVYCPQLIKD